MLPYNQEFTDALAKCLSLLPKGQLAEVFTFTPQVGFGDHEAGQVTAILISSSQEDLERAKQVVHSGISAKQQGYGLTDHVLRTQILPAG